MTDFIHGGAATAERNADIAAFILRVSTGVWFLVHGLTKLFVFTPAGTAGYFESIGLPGLLGYLTMLAEILGGLALIGGIFTRIIALVMAALLLGAAWFGHGSAGFSFSNPGGGWEYPVLWAITMVALSLLGDGVWSLGRRR
uniref:DoxX family protein n=1 Tax=Paracoccus sp. TRP TaxID=412597 RepID=UPI000225FA42|nr:DoxX family protein [Paracoccus sp. TRP]